MRAQGNTPLLPPAHRPGITPANPRLLPPFPGSPWLWGAAVAQPLLGADSQRHGWSMTPVPSGDPGKWPRCQ